MIRDTDKLFYRLNDLLEARGMPGYRASMAAGRADLAAAQVTTAAERSAVVERVLANFFRQRHRQFTDDDAAVLAAQVCDLKVMSRPRPRRARKSA